MRSSLLATLALSATLTSAFAPSIADACGGYMRDPLPAVFAVDGRHAVRRTFVVLGGASAVTDAAWTALAPGTFDATQIAELPDPARSTTFTLVGPSGARVISTNRSALLSKSFLKRDPHSALEISIGDSSQFRIAVLGVQPDATWLAATEVEPTAQNRAWVKQQGLDTTYLHVSKIAGTKLLVISGHRPNDIELTSFVVSNGTSLGSYTGTAIGALVMGNKRFVILETNGLITPVAV